MYYPVPTYGFKTFHLSVAELDVHQFTLNVDITN
jgi:hypothetical protein